MKPKDLRRSLRWAASAVMAASALAAAGCGDDSGLARRYAVSGRVTYKGEPVKKASITFHPTQADGRPATGTVEDGRYSLTTLVPGDGALPGTYKVTVDDREVDMSKVRSESDALAKKRGVEKFGSIPQELLVQAARKAKGGLPGRYQIVETTDIEKEVQARSNSIDIELKD